jgi:beta-N-acetylhexosaminidase
MTSTQALGPVMFDLRGSVLSPDECAKLAAPAAGGIILFSRNYRSPAQLAELVAAIRAVRADILIAVDHEGGRVQRFREGFTVLPAAADYGKALAATPERLPSTVETAGWLMAAELRAFDVDFSFAPVLDVDAGISEIIGDRAFSDDPGQAAELALAFAAGMRRAGMAAVGKHFPGHGGVAADSHLELPVDRRCFRDIENRDLLPFQAMIRSGLEGIMPAHVVYPEVDAAPAGFSPFWIRDVLRGRLGFRGAVFSDDLSMAGAGCAGDYPARARLALEAGCDMVLVCNAPEAAAEVLDMLADHSDPERAARLGRMRGRFGIDRTALLSGSEWENAVQTMAYIQAQVGNR